MNSFSRGKRGIAGNLVYEEFHMPKMILIKVPVNNSYAYFVWHSEVKDYFHCFITLEELFELKLRLGNDIKIEEFMYIGTSIQNHVRSVIRVEHRNKLQDKYLISEEEL